MPEAVPTSALTKFVSKNARRQQRNPDEAQKPIATEPQAPVLHLIAHQHARLRADQDHGRQEDLVAAGVAVADAGRDRGIYGICGEAYMCLEDFGFEHRSETVSPELDR